MLPEVSPLLTHSRHSYHPPHDASSHSLNFHLGDVQSKVCFHIQQKHYSHKPHKFHLKNRSCRINYWNGRRHLVPQPRTRASKTQMKKEAHPTAHLATQYTGTPSAQHKREPGTNTTVKEVEAQSKSQSTGSP